MLNDKEITVTVTIEQYKKFIEATVFAEKQAMIDELQAALDKERADKEYWVDYWAKESKRRRELQATVDDLRKQLSDLQDELQAADEKVERERNDA